MSNSSTQTHKDDATDASPTNHSPNDTTRFQLDLLAVIAGYETGRYQNNRHSSYLPHGLAIKHTLKDYYGEEVHHGRLYPNLDTLVERGLIEKTQADRRTNYYGLTSAGWEYLHRRAQFVVGCLDEGDADPAAAHAGVEDDETDDAMVADSTEDETVDVKVPEAETVDAGVYGEVTEGSR